MLTFVINTKKRILEHFMGFRLSIMFLAKEGLMAALLFVIAWHLAVKTALASMPRKYDLKGPLN